jgi:PAT family beta-lactamase induction signal transducer AmpG
MRIGANYCLMKSWALGNSVHVQAYRIAGLVPGSLALILADQLPWVWVFWVTAGFMLVGVLLSLSISEPDRAPPQKHRL